MDFWDIPGHTQRIKHISPIVCAASRKTADISAWEGIASTIRSLKSVPSLEHKKIFVSLVVEI